MVKMDELEEETDVDCKNVEPTEELDENLLLCSTSKSSVAVETLS